MLSIRGLDQYYGESHTLWDLSLEVAPGMCTCVLGRNGVGKTTLLKAIMGLVPVRGGRIVYKGEDLAGKPPELRARRGIGYVPQGREIFSRLTVEENLRIGLVARGVRAGAAAAIRDRLLGLFPALVPMLARAGGDLSGGQQQQLAIARALALEPELLILDEPGEGIQPNIVQQIGDVLLALREQGLTILLVEQKLPFARRVAQHFAILDRGRMVADGAMGELDDTLVAKHLRV